MDMRKALSLAIAIGIAFVALQGNFGARAQPWPSHVVAGAVTTLPDANDANAVAWLLTNTSGPLVIQNRLDPDPTPPNNPTFAVDIGNFNYDWSTTDQVLVAFEVVRGVNGHVGVNWTGSVNAQLTNDNVQALPDSTLQQYPSMTAEKSSRSVWVNFTGLTNTNGNIIRYGVWRSPTPFVPVSWTRVGSVTHAAGALTFAQASLADGTYCYRVNVEYRRDVAGTIVNGTTGASEWSANTCQSIQTPPWITSTNPADRAADVAVTAPIIINFNKQINTVTFNKLVTSGGHVPVFAAPTWNAGNDQATLTHVGDDFDTCAVYNVTVTAQDASGQNLIPGPPSAPNPWQFNTICPNPMIGYTTPASGATGVKRDLPILINFTKAMDQTPTHWNVIIHPVIPFTTSWTNPFNLQVTPTSPLTLCTAYTVKVAANDTGGNPLSGGAPNPWTFTANCLATVTVTAPTLNACFAKGETFNITWTMVDETPNAYLQTTLTYNSSGGWGPISSGTGWVRYGWLVPTGLQGNDFRANVNATDNATDTGTGASPAFTIDQIAPTGAGTFPSSGQTIPYTTTSTIYVNFSKNMNHTATQGAIVITTGSPPVPTGNPAFSWTDDMHLVITATLAARTGYNLTVSTVAKDKCGSGNFLGADWVIPFFVGGKQPKAPVLSKGDITESSATLTWTVVTQYVDDSTITGTVTYQLYRNGAAVGTPSTSTSYTDTGLSAATDYLYFVRAIVDNTQSGNSNTVPVTTNGKTTGTDWTWLIIILIIIIIVVVLLAVLLMRRKKPEVVVEEAPPAEEVPAEEAPVEEAPAEEAPPEGETPPEGEAPPEGEGGDETPPPA